MKSKGVVIFCGAAVSEKKPSSIPLTSKFTLSLLTKLFQNENYDIEDFKENLPRLETLLQIIRDAHGETFIDALKPMEYNSPNRNHRIIVELAKCGWISHIVTTNFDLFLEKAFRISGFSESKNSFGDKSLLKTFKFKNIEIPLLKLHGCISEPSSLIATIRQFAIGLPEIKQDLLLSIIDKKPILFIGYSGSDFDISPVLFDSKMNEIWWLSRGKKSGMNPKRERIMSKFKSNEIIMDISEFLEARLKQSEQKLEDLQLEETLEIEKTIDRWVKGIYPAMRLLICANILHFLGFIDKSLYFYSKTREKCLEDGNLDSIEKIKVQIACALGEGEILEKKENRTDAKKRYLEVLKISRDDKFIPMKCLAFCKIGKLLIDSANWDDAKLKYMGALKIANDNNLIDQQAMALSGLADILYYAPKNESELEKAIGYYQESLLNYQHSGNLQGQMDCYEDIASIVYLKGRYDLAIENDSMCLELAKDMGDKYKEAFSLGNIGTCYVTKGEFLKGIEKLEKAVRVCESIGDSDRFHQYLGNLGRAYMEFGKLQHAREKIQKAVKWFEQTKNKSYLVHYLTALGEISIREGKNKDAIGILNRSIAICKEINDRYELVHALYFKAIAQFELGNKEGSLMICRIALPISLEQEDRYMEGALKELRGELENDISFLNEALEIFTTLGVENKIQEIKQTIMKYNAK